MIDGRENTVHVIPIITKKNQKYFIVNTAGIILQLLPLLPPCDQFQHNDVLLLKKYNLFQEKTQLI